MRAFPQKACEMSHRSKILRTLLVLGVVACIAGAGVFSAFSSQTENPGNTITTGTVNIEDNDGSVALYAMTAAKPGEAKTSCIKVTYKGSLPATVKFYTPSTIGELGPYVNLKVEAGTQTTSTFPSCTEFTPLASSPTLYEGTLAAFATEHGTYANGITTNPASATKWETNNALVYRFTATLSSSAPNSAQGASTGTHAFRWEAQNQ
jgi:predicted ribosomally synthesized peptide with SipW-like signal peptide